MKFFSPQFIRFVLVGVANTAISYVLYVVANRFMDYRWAYSVSYALSIGVSYVLNSRWVFREPLSLAKFLKFPLVYLVQYLVGLLLVWLLVSRLNVPEWMAPLVVVMLTVPLTYVLSRSILKPRARNEH